MRFSLWMSTIIVQCYLCPDVDCPFGLINNELFLRALAYFDCDNIDAQCIIELFAASSEIPRLSDDARHSATIYLAVACARLREYANENAEGIHSFRRGPT